MASILNITLFFLAFLLLITNSIHGYRLNQHLNAQDQPILIDDDLTSNNRLNLRSVLWPKICFTTLIKKTGHQHPNDQYQQHEYSKHISTRNARKCYPFDTV